MILWGFHKGWDFGEKPLKELVEDQQKDKRRIKDEEREHTRYMDLLVRRGRVRTREGWNPRNLIWVTLEECARLESETWGRVQRTREIIEARRAHIRNLEGK